MQERGEHYTVSGKVEEREIRLMKKSVNNRMIALILAVLTVLLCACSSNDETQVEETETVEIVEEVKTFDEVAVLFTGKMLGANKSESDFGPIKERAEELKKQNIKVDIVDCGDYLSKDATGTADAATSTLRAMASAGYSHAVINEREFDFGIEGLREFIASEGMKNMSCNFRYSGFEDDITARIPRYDVIEIGNVKIGYVAVSNPDVLESNKEIFIEDGRIAYGFCGRTSSFLGETVQASINACLSEGVDKVILLSGITSSQKVGIAELLMMTSGVDACICAFDSGSSETLELCGADNQPIMLGCLRGGADSLGELRISPEGNITFSFK